MFWSPTGRSLRENKLEVYAKEPTRKVPAITDQTMSAFANKPQKNPSSFLIDTLTDPCPKLWQLLGGESLVSLHFTKLNSSCCLNFKKDLFSTYET